MLCRSSLAYLSMSLEKSLIPVVNSPVPLSLTPFWKEITFSSRRRAEWSSRLNVEPDPLANTTRRWRVDLHLRPIRTRPSFSSRCCRTWTAANGLLQSAGTVWYRGSIGAPKRTPPSFSRPPPARSSLHLLLVHFSYQFLRHRLLWLGLLN